MVAPIWSMRTVPGSIRGAFAVVLALVLLPTVATTPAPHQMVVLPLAMGTELLFGVAIGLTAGVMVHSVRLAAAVVSIQMGLSMLATLLPTAVDAVPGMGQLKSLTMLAIYAAFGGHLMLLTGLGSSLQAVPPGAGVDIVAGGAAMVALVGTLFSAAARVAAPIIVILLLANIAIGVVGKAVPQLNVLMVAFPVTIALGLIAYGMSIPYVATLLIRWVEDLPNAVVTMIEAFAPASAVR